MREPVPEIEELFEDVIVRVPLGLLVPVFELVSVEVPVAVTRIDFVKRGEREILALPVDVREPRTDAVKEPLAEDVFVVTGLRVPVGHVDAVFDEVVVLVVVLEAVVVFVAVVVEDIVLLLREVTVENGLALDVLDTAPVCVNITVDFTLFVDVELGVGNTVGGTLRESVVVFVEVFEELDVREGTI